MDLVDGAELAADEGVVPLDFSLDYRQSSELQAEPLTLPSRANVLAAILSEMSVPADVVDQAMTAIAAGRHVIFYGPPGTGKTTIAQALARAYGVEPITHTASADWTPFETAGGLQLELQDGEEALVPRAGVITEAVVECLHHLAAEKAGRPTEYAGAWLIIDEINRANVDAALGPYFNALDAAHPTVSLAFMDPPRRHISVPSRFRVIGTMNTYDKNFLFRLSYALTRRFALIELGVPANDDQAGRLTEGLGILRALTRVLAGHGVTKTEEEVATDYEVGLNLVYQRLGTMIRAAAAPGLGRGIGFAQISSALSQAVLAFELGYGEPGEDPDRLIDAVDRGVTASIVPQLEGLPSSRLKQFTDSWANDEELKRLERSLAAARALISGLDLFLAETE